MQRLFALTEEIFWLMSHYEGVCHITTLLYKSSRNWVISNSHAGSHADQPYHWLEDPPFESFDIRQYNGTATILDVFPYLDQNNPVITSRILDKAAEDNGINLNETRRLLLRTYHQIPEEWDGNFAYLDPDTASYLGLLPKLVMLGTDAPSVDHEDAAPIHKCSHGGLWAGRIAIIEGYNSDNLPIQPQLDGVLQTALIDISKVRDAKTAMIYFYPTRKYRF